MIDEEDDKLERFQKILDLSVPVKECYWLDNENKLNVEQLIEKYSANETVDYIHFLQNAHYLTLNSRRLIQKKYYELYNEYGEIALYQPIDHTLLEKIIQQESRLLLSNEEFNNMQTAAVERKKYQLTIIQSNLNNIKFNDDTLNNFYKNLYLINDANQLLHQ